MFPVEGDSTSDYLHEQLINRRKCIKEKCEKLYPVEGDYPRYYLKEQLINRRKCINLVNKI